MKDLYNDGKIRITPARTPEEHGLSVGNSYCYLLRGILKEFAETDSAGLAQMLININSDFLSQLLCEGVSMERLGWALAKARIKELDNEVNYFVREYNKLKARIDE